MGNRDEQGRRSGTDGGDDEGWGANVTLGTELRMEIQSEVKICCSL
jgi:hypothetical protein